MCNSFFLETPATLFILATVTTTLISIYYPTKNYNKISWRHLLHDINLCKTKYCQDFSKDTVIWLEQRCCHSFTCTNWSCNSLKQSQGSPYSGPVCCCIYTYICHSNYTITSTSTVIPKRNYFASECSKFLVKRARLNSQCQYKS
jgi:hypothetical protein